MLLIGIGNDIVVTLIHHTHPMLCLLIYLFGTLYETAYVGTYLTFTCV